MQRIMMKSKIHRATITGADLNYIGSITLDPVERIDADTLVALAAFVGKARLIDNVTITFRGDTACPDLGVLTASSGMQEADH